MPRIVYNCEISNKNRKCDEKDDEQRIMIMIAHIVNRRTKTPPLLL